ncbi:MAG TPA: polyhydroxyalkanoate depolymerase [Acidisoma sp.]|uniref:polyhydroxyalkanoate depolymerase n=1 Tax=Acidisoma sp. TaxID=1872115 RepID=UPI002C3420F3|nr:polyhydroxyalkanoate depolymerase [Acidisoma sp.]HTH99544.1 polyhydroxyalkanoate depolymerase [Acidisoma sp.]
MNDVLSPKAGNSFYQSLGLERNWMTGGKEKNSQSVFYEMARPLAGLPFSDYFAAIGTPMLYQLYQAQADMMEPARRWAEFTGQVLNQFDLTKPEALGLRGAAAMTEAFWRTAITHQRPAYGLRPVVVGNRPLAITEEVVMETPFCSLLHFRKESPVRQPRVLVVAPMSGHFATLLRNTVQTLLADHDVYITDWKNVRDVPLSAGVFGFEDYTDHVIQLLEAMGPGGHVLAVCQPAVPVLAAVSVMAREGNIATPRSMTLMAGPIDTRVAVTRVNVLAQEKPIEWFDNNVIGIVPWRFKGANRRVYPGFMQLSAFVAMNFDRHLRAEILQARNIVGGDEARAEVHRKFYDEYRAVMDLPAEFFLETVKRIFQDHDLPLGRMTHRGERVDPGAIRRTMVLTVEGERDDICGVGQTMSALDLCTGLPTTMKQHHLQTNVGHYGVFSGSHWAREIYPKVRAVIEMSS